MFGLRGGLIAALLGAVPAPLYAHTCPEARFGEEFLGSYSTELSPNQARLIVIRQQARDLQVLLNTAQQAWLNGPGGRNGVDFVFLEASPAEVSRELCFFTVFRHGAPGSYRVQEIDLDASATELADVLQVLNAAGITWLARDAAALGSVVAPADTLGELSDAVFAESDDLAFFVELGLALTDIGLRRYDQALARLTAMLREPFMSHSHFHQVRWQLGRIHMRQNHMQKGIDQLEQAKTLLTPLAIQSYPGFRYDLAEINNLLIEARTTSRQLDLASANLQEAIDAAGKDFELLGKIFNNAGYLSIRESEQPDIDKASKLRLLNRSTEEHLSASYFSREAGDLSGLQIIENNLAVHYARIGERRKSLVHFLNVLELLEEFSNPETRAFLYSNLSNYAQILGDYNKAYAYLQYSISLATDSATTKLAAYACRSGTLQRLLDEPALALEQHRQCALQAERENDALSRVEAALQTSADFALMGQLPDAEAFARDSLALLPGVNEIADRDNNLTQRSWIQLALVLSAQERWQEASEAVRAALTRSIDERHSNDKVQAVNLAMRIEYKLGNVEAALTHANEGISFIEDLHTELEAERMGPAWSNQTDRLYEDLADIHLDNYLTDRDAAGLALAFQTSERSRDISLRQRLASNIPNDAIALEEDDQLRLFSKISSLLAEAGGSDSSPPPLTSLEYYHQHDLLSLARLRGVETLPIPQALSLDELQNELAPDQLMLYYINTSDALYVLAISSTDLAVKKTDKDDYLRSMMDDEGTFLHSPDSFSAADMQTLSKYLLPDLGRYQQARELLIVSDDSLYAFPFAALQVSDEQDAYTPLISRYSLTNVPSASIYFMKKTQGVRTYPVEVSIIADPVFKDIGLAFDANSPTSNIMRGWSESLDPLPYTAQEAASIEQSVTGPTLAFTGTAATRANLSSEVARNSRILHIATHGYFRSLSEDNIGLALSTVNAEGNKDPGFITLTELFGYAFNNELVVISGCDTAMGKEQDGVGLNSLSRGFLAQGVEHVIATLWPVSDRASAEFMKLFYQHLQQTKNVTTALQLTQSNLSRHPLYRNPYYWAGYVLTSVSPDATIALPD